MFQAQQQKNGYDCGLFLIGYAKHIIAKVKTFTFIFSNEKIERSVRVLTALKKSLNPWIFIFHPWGLENPLNLMLFYRILENPLKIAIFNLVDYNVIYSL